MNPLDQLKDIHLPPAVSAWPPAWPWWVLLLLVIACGALFIWLRKRNAWRRAAQQAYNQIDWQQPNQAYREANKLLKQIAIQKLGRSCAQLSGEEWLAFLDKHVNKPIFMPELRPFAHVLDEPNIHVDDSALQRAVKTWIRKVKC